jgi:hypothetical protein
LPDATLSQEWLGGRAARVFLNIEATRNNLCLIRFGVCAFAIRVDRAHGAKEGKMNDWIRAASVLLAIAGLAIPTLGQSATTTEAATSKAPKTRMQLFFGPDIDMCDPDCPEANAVQVKVSEGSFTDAAGNKTVSCLVTLNKEVHIVGKTGPFDRHRVIVWKMVPPSPPSPTVAYRFQADRGIVTLSGDIDQVTDSFAIGTTIFVVKHKNRKRNGQITYYPLVEQVVSGSPPTLCAAADPKITNEGG